MQISPTKIQERTPKVPASYSNFSFRIALELAAPHTWPAAIIPVLFATSIASLYAPISLTLGFALLAICILMQSAANTFNDYFDFVKGTDSLDDTLESDDAALLHNNVNLSSVRFFGISLLVLAFLIGSYVICVAGWITLALGLIGALVVVLYSGGKTPLSYLPIGEIVSGIVMGGIIPLACFYSFTSTLDFRVLIWSIPCIVGIALIMMTNNTCDIEKDIQANRKTLSVMWGRDRIRTLYRTLVLFWLISIPVIIMIWFGVGGLLVALFMLLSAYPLVRALFKNPLTQNSRIGAFAQICGLNITLGAFYCAAILAQNMTVVL